MLWCKRRPAIAALAASVILAVVAGTASVIAVQARANRDLEAKNRELARANAELAEEKGRVQRRFELAQEAIRTFHTGVIEDVLLREKQFDALRTKLLREAREFYRKLEGMLRGQLDRASRRAMGKTYLELSLLAGKIEGIDTSTRIARDALAVFEGRYREDPTHLEARRELGLAWNFFGARRYSQTGGLTEAMEAYRHAYEILDPLAQVEPPDVEARLELASVCNSLSYESAGLGGRESRGEAIALQDRARALVEGLARLETLDESLRLRVARFSDTQAVVLGQLQRQDEANESFARARAILDDLVHVHPTNPESASAFTRAYGNSMVSIDEREGRRDEERLALGRRVREVCDRMAVQYPAITAYRGNKAWVDLLMAMTLIEIDRDAEALPLLEEARSIRADQVRSDPNSTRFQEQLATVLLNLRATHARAGRFPEARAARAEAVTIQTRNARSNHEDATLLDNQASALTNSSDLILRCDRADDDALMAQEAGAGYREAVAIRERLIVAHPKAVRFRNHLAYSLRRLALVERDLGDVAGAVAKTTRATMLYEGLPPEEARDWSGFELACCRATLVGLAGPRTSQGEDPALADHAMDLLRKAAAMGFRDRIAFQHDPGLVVLRNRPDFRLLMMDLSFPASPLAQ